MLANQKRLRSSADAIKKAPVTDITIGQRKIQNT